jgi:hypothetical protein
MIPDDDSLDEYGTRKTNKQTVTSMNRATDDT